MIREAKLADIHDLAYLMGELGYPTTPTRMQKRMEVIMREANYYTLVFEREKQVIGMVGMIKGYRYESDIPYIRIVAMVVDSKYRGVGIGKELLQAAENKAKELGANMVTLNSGNREERSNAHAFYTSQNYIGSATGFYKTLE